MAYGLQLPDYLPVFLKLHLVLNLIFVLMVPTILLYAVVCLAVSDMVSNVNMPSDAMGICAMDVVDQETLEPSMPI